MWGSARAERITTNNEILRYFRRLPWRKGHLIVSFWVTRVTLLNRIVRKRSLEKVTIEKTSGGNKEACVWESGAGTFQAEGRPNAKH